MKTPIKENGALNFTSLYSIHKTDIIDKINFISQYRVAHKFRCNFESPELSLCAKFLKKLTSN